MDTVQELQQAGFSDAEINQHISKQGSELRAAGFSDREVADHFGFTQTYADTQVNKSLLQRARDYLGISETPKRPTPTKMDATMRGELESNYGVLLDDRIASDETDVEFQRVLAQGLSGLTGGISELLGGKVERPQTIPGVIAGAGAELAGFIAGPFKAGKLLLGSRLTPTASGLKGMAQLLTQGGAQLGIASGLSRIIPAFLDDPDFGNYGLDILKSTAMGTLTGVIYPLMGAVPTQPLRIATTLAVMDKIRAGVGQWFTFDDFVTGIKDGTIDKKELGQMGFNYLMDIYFASKTPSMRVQLKSLADNAIVKEIQSLDPDKVAQTILDISNTDSMDTMIKDLELRKAVQYDGKTYESKPGEIHAQTIDRNGLSYDEKLIDGYVDKNGEFLTRDKITSALREGEGRQPDNMRESLPEKFIEPESVYQEIKSNEGPEAELLVRGLNQNGIITIDTHSTGDKITVQISGDNKIIDPLWKAGLLKEGPYKPGIDESYYLTIPKSDVNKFFQIYMRDTMFDGGGVTGESPLEMTLRYGPEKEMAQAGTESMLERGIVRDPKKLMSEQLAEEFMADPARYQEIMQKYGMGVEDFAKTLKEEASSWGRKLGELGLESQRLETKYPQFAEAMRELHDINKIPSPWDRVRSLWKSFDQIRRGMLVTQLSTSARNLETQLGRVGLDVFEKGIDSGLQKLTGKEVTTSPMDGVQQLVDIIRRSTSKKITETVLKLFPKEYDRLYGSYMADIEPGQMGHAIGKGVDILNTVNRFQEFLFRNGVFKASLEQKLSTEGRDLVKIIEENKVGAIPQETIQYAVDRALEMTFAQAPKKGGVGDALVKFVNNFPGVSFIMPFPRFFVNSTKFVFEYNPTGFLKLLSKQERTAIANGDMHVLSRATLGTIMLGLAYFFRDSEYAGEKWYEIQAGDKVIDTRPFNPFASYLFMADVTHKLIHGNLDRLTSKDIALGVFSSNMRAGMGLYAMDQIFNAISRTGDPQKAADLVKSMAGELVGGFLTPFNQIKEFISGFDKYIVREKRSDPFWGPIKEKMPWLDRTLPELYSPTKEGPVTRELPVLRQVTGLAISTKNSFEKELDRLGFQYAEIFHSTGNPEADNLIKKHMGELSTQVMDPLVSSKDFTAMGDAQKGYIISEMLNGIRQAGKGMTEGDKPELFFKIFFDRMPKREKAMLEETGVDLKALEKQLTEPTKEVK